MLKAATKLAWKGGLRHSCGTRVAGRRSKPPPPGKRASRNPSLSANAARAAGDAASQEDAKLASGVIRDYGIKGSEAAAALKPPLHGKARLAQSLPSLLQIPVLWQRKRATNSAALLQNHPSVYSTG